MNKKITYILKEKDNGFQVKQVLSGILGLSRREITRLNQSGGIQRNGNGCRLTEPVKTGDILTLTFPAYDAAKVQRMSGKPDILYEDDHYVAINKPYGMPCHPTHEHKDDDMGTLLQKYYGGSFTIRPIGRLDKDVSGIMIYAKSKEAAAALSACREKGNYHKYYEAVVKGHFNDAQGTLVYHLSKDAKTRSFQKNDSGKECITRYEVIQEYKSVTHIRIEILTGRTHQIRAGFASYHHSLIGDRLYVGDDKKINRPCLHSSHVSFVHPFTSELIDISCPLAEDISAVLRKS